MLVQPGVRTPAAWSPDGKKLYYAKNGRENPHWSLVFDLYVFDLEKHKEERLTYGRRVLSPSVSPDGRRLMCVANADGTTNLAEVGTDGAGFHLVTSFTQGEQVYNPKWAPDGSRVVFDLSSGHGRDLAAVDTTGNNFRLLVSGPADDRNATFAPDGPETCSGLPVRRYTAAEIAVEVDLTLQRQDHRIHTTPWGSTQPFTVAVLSR